MSEGRMLFKNDLDSNEEYQDILKAIKGENATLYYCLMENISKNTTVGIREDVLMMIAQNVGRISNFLHDDIGRVTYFALLTNNSGIGAEWYEWMLSQDNWITAIGMDNFFILIGEIQEHHISLESFKEIYSSEDDFADILKKISDYKEEQLKEEQADFQEEMQNASETDAAQKQLEENETAEVAEAGQTEVCTEQNLLSREQEVSNIFGNLLTVMSEDNVKNNISMQNELSKIIASFQTSFNEISTFAYDLIHQWNSDRQEMERLKALFQLQQQVLSSQTMKINELRNLLNQKDNEIRESVQRDIKHEEINKKIMELKSLSEETAGFNHISL